MKYNELHINDIVNILPESSSKISHLNPGFEMDIDGKYFRVISMSSSKTFEILVDDQIITLENSQVMKVIESITVVTQYSPEMSPTEEFILEFPSKNFKEAYILKEREYAFPAYSKYVSTRAISERAKRKSEWGKVRLAYAETKGFQRIKRSNRYRISTQNSFVSPTPTNVA